MVDVCCGGRCCNQPQPHQHPSDLPWYRCARCGHHGELWPVQDDMDFDDGWGPRPDPPPVTSWECSAIGCDAEYSRDDIAALERVPNYWAAACSCGHLRGDHAGTPDAPGSLQCAHSDGTFSYKGCAAACDCTAFRPVVAVTVDG